MSNHGHLQKFGEGVAAWNHWRKASPGTVPDLSKADLTPFNDCSGIDLRKTHLDEANFKGVNLEDAIFQAASLRSATLVNTDLSGVDIRGADLTGAIVDGVQYDRRMKCLGARVDLCTGSPRFIRHVHETDYIESFSAEHRFLSFIWGLTSCHSRSFLRAAQIAVAFILLFSLVYWLTPGMVHWSTSTAHRSEADLPFFESLYYSVAVFTTVGANAIFPHARSGEFVTEVEVILGYIWLGYLVSILAQRATARS